MRSVLKKLILVLSLCVLVISMCGFTYGPNDLKEKEVEKVSIEIYDAIKDIDLKKVVALSDYDGTYDTRYLDQFFDKYSGSKDIVKTLLDTLVIDIKDIKKIDGTRYKASLDIDMIDIDKLVSKIALKVGIDIIRSKFNLSTHGNDIINIFLKRIGEVLDKDSYEKMSFSYDVEYVYKNGSYKLCSKKIIDDVYEKLKPVLSHLR